MRRGLRRDHLAARGSRLVGALLRALIFMNGMSITQETTCFQPFRAAEGEAPGRKLEGWESWEGQDRLL